MACSLSPGSNSHRGCGSQRRVWQLGGWGNDWWTPEGQAVGSQHASLLSGKGLNRWTHNKSILLGFFFGNVIFSIRMLTNAPLIAHSTASAVWYPRPEEMQNHKKKDSNWSRELYNHMIQLAGFIFVSWVPYFLKPEIHSHTMEALYYL